MTKLEIKLAKTDTKVTTFDELSKLNDEHEQKSEPNIQRV